LRSGEPLTPQQSEAFLNALFEERVLKPSILSAAEKRILMNLANALQQNHRDSWLKDFLNAPFSSPANHLLEAAIADRDSDARRDLDEASAAENLYLKAGNIAGAARSQAELIYANRRLSRSDDCLKEIVRLKRRIAQRGYSSFEILSDLEDSNCQTMLGNFHLGRQLAVQTNREAGQANYPSLKLRVMGLISSSDSLEGRLQAAFATDAAGLEVYWTGSYDGRRAFQFYSDAALMANQAGFWHLAELLQREAIDSLEGTDLFDFQATAHYLRALALERSGQPLEAQKELSAAYDLFGRMRNPSFLLANSELELAEIEIEQGNLSSAQAHLEKASSTPDLKKADNFLIKLSYYNTLANLDRHRNLPDEEWKHLRNTIEIAQRGFLKLNSMDNRWEWYRQVDHSFHRLIELELEMNHDPAQALADWEAYRAAEIAPALLTPESSVGRDLLFSRLKELRSSTLVSFIVFPEKIVILVADDRGIRPPFTVAVASETLRHETEKLLHLCSDRESSLAKVNAAGLRLYKRLLQPIEKELAPGRRLDIEADSFLSRVPWPALMTESGKYLDEEHMTVSTPGLFFTAARPDRKKASGSRLVAYPGAAEFEGKVYPPLPHAKEEAEYVAELQPGSVYLPESEVTMDELLRRLPRASSFHFAGHAASREHGGELLLSGKDHVLSASAVRSLDLRSMDLVVLSACSTAEADLDVARSPNGLVQAFLSAGAKQVMASRWDVDSGRSLDFMKYFASESARSNDAQQAIRTARDKVRREAIHPYYWASFDLFGN